MCIKFSEPIYNPDKYKEEFRKNLKDDNLFEKIQAFFNHLFLEDTTDRPLDERCYIVITRKGFSLWVAGMLCGMIGKKPLNSKTLISDRQWRMMSIDERNEFIKDKHVFVADDSVVTGAMSQSVYLEIEAGEGRAKSRSVAFLVADQSYNFRSMYEYYYTSDEVNVERRREYNDKTLYAMYQLAIPFTACSPVCYVQMSQLDFKNLRDKYSKNDEDSWMYKDTPLTFGDDAKAERVGVFIAPYDALFGENVLLRGIRVCYSELRSDGMVDVTFIPWIIFDAIDYVKARKYLKDCAVAYIPGYKDKCLYKQLDCGEPSRVQTLVHRVVSYLYDCCVLKEFTDFLEGVNLSPFTLPNSSSLEQYHFPQGLCDDLEIIKNAINKDGNTPTNVLAMDEATHDDLAKNIYTTSYSRLEMPKTQYNDINDIEIKLLKQREVVKDENGNPIFPSSTRKHPLICYSNKRSLTVLKLIRRAIGSLRSEIISYKDKVYLINTLVPGEGSHLVFYNHSDFIYAYHQWVNMELCLPGQEKAFVDKWNSAVEKWSRTATQEEQNRFKFSVIDTNTADAYFGTISEVGKERQYPVYDLPSEYAVFKSKGIDLDCFTGEEEHCSYFRKIEKIVANM